MSRVSPNDGEAGDSSGEESDSPDLEAEAIVSTGRSEGDKPADPEKMDKIAGYDNIYFSAVAMPPPEVVLPEKPGESASKPDFSAVPVVTEDQARFALIEHVAAQCCWGKGAAEKLTFKKLQSSTSYHYILETYTEGRTTEWAHEPFHGQPVDGPENGEAPAAWSIPCQSAQLFQDQTVYLEVPHTASVKNCHVCGALGYLICRRCQGRGRVRCGTCRGKGTRRKRKRKKDGRYVTVRVTCSFCSGSGRRRCTRCGGDGKVTCDCCKGHCRLRWFLQLTIRWINRKGDHILERTELPDQLIAGVQGNIVYQDTQKRLWPIVSFPDNEINQASARLVDDHGKGFPYDLILMQRHTVRAVPVTECFTTCKDKDMLYYVYGLESRVFSPDYPDQCCWGCTIL